MKLRVLPQQHIKKQHIEQIVTLINYIHYTLTVKDLDI